MSPLTPEQLVDIAELPVENVIPHYVARYWDMVALAKHMPCKVIGETALIKDKPGFEVELLVRTSISKKAYQSAKDEVLMVMRGHWKLTWGNDQLVLNPGDTCWVPADLFHSIEVCVSGEASLYRVTGTDDDAGLTWQGE